jgi:hypothetical protein
MACEKCLDHESKLPKAYRASHETTEIEFDVEKAWELVKEYRLRTYTGINPELLRVAVEVNDFDPVHLDHVNMDNPVLFAEMPWLGADAPAAIIITEPPVPKELTNENNSHMYYFLDGSHRAARAIRDNTQDKLKWCMLPVKLTMKCLMSITVENFTVLYND